MERLSILYRTDQASSTTDGTLIKSTYIKATYIKSTYIKAT